jgi:hypothetical protein
MFISCSYNFIFVRTLALKTSLFLCCCAPSNKFLYLSSVHNNRKFSRRDPNPAERPHLSRRLSAWDNSKTIARFILIFDNGQLHEYLSKWTIFSKTRKWSRGTSHRDLHAFLIFHRTWLFKCLSERGQSRTKMKHLLYSSHFRSYEFKGERTSWDGRISWVVYLTTINAYPTLQKIAERPTVVFRTHTKDTEVSYWTHPYLWRALIRSASPSVGVRALTNSKTSNWFLNKILNWILRKTFEYFRLYLYQSILMSTLLGDPRVFMREPRA